MSSRPRVVRKRAFYWIPVYPPEFLGKEPFIKILTVDPKDLINRIVRIKATGYVSTYEDQLMDLLFRVNKITPSGAHTVFVGHQYPREVVSTIVRRRRSRCEVIARVITKDHHRVKVSMIAMTSKRAHYNQRRAIRRLMNTYISDKAREFDAQHFLWNLVIRKAFHREILSLIHKVYPIRDFIIYKSFDESSLIPHAEVSSKIEGDISKILDKIAEAVRLR